MITKTIAAALTSLCLSLFAVSLSAQVLDGVSLQPVEGRVFSFVGPSGAGKTTMMIGVAARFISIGQDEDQIIADLDKRDIFARDPGGGLISLRQMTERFAPAAGATGAVAPSTGSEKVTDADAEFEALLEGLPAPLKAQLKAQFEALPRDQAIMALSVLRSQMGLPSVAPGNLPKAAPTKGVVKTGATQTLNGLELHEYIAAGDRIWAVDSSKIESGAALVQGLVEFGALYREISRGLPVDDSSFFQIGELEGRAPYLVQTEDGKSFTYAGTSVGNIMVPQGH